MLSQKLHELFKKYIADGKKRAPPASDLTGLFSTFQEGARTDRRALQSKFKNWAKRMAVENDKLKLLSSGKEIVPLEKYRDVVMNIHLDEHKSVDQVVCLIQTKYTWTKKNFGMDRDVVLDCISRNCTNAECKLQVDNESIKGNCCKKFIKNVISTSEFHPIVNEKQAPQSSSFVISSPMFMNPPPMYAWPVSFPMPSPSGKFYFPYDINNNSASAQKSSTVSGELQFYLPSSRRGDQDRNACLQAPRNYHNLSSNHSYKRILPAPKRKAVHGTSTYRKPRNIIEFKSLMRAAERLSDTYPSILTHPKTKFLGCLDLVPMKICSKRTLLKFKKEKRRKKVLEKQHFMYSKNRKILRDRNKLNKVKLEKQREKRAYLDISGSRRSPNDSGIEPLSSNNELSSSHCRKHKFGGEIVKIAPQKGGIEIIEVTSSEDEENYLNNKFSSMREKAYEVKKKDDGSKAFKRPVCLKRSLQPLKEENKQSLFRECDRAIDCTPSCSFPKSSNCFQLEEANKQHQFLEPCLIPTNIRRKIAALQTSQCPTMKPLRRTIIAPDSAISEVSQNIPKVSQNIPKVSKNILKVSKNIPKVNLNINESNTILKPDQNVMSLQKQETHILKNSCLINRIPSDTNIFLVEKETSGFKMVPYGSSSMNKQTNNLNTNPNTTSEIGRNKLPSIEAERQFANILDANPNINECPWQVLHSNKNCVDDKMSKLSKWIRNMRSTMMYSLIQRNVTRSSQKLQSELNVGISLVKSIRKTLYEIEKLENRLL